MRAQRQNHDGDPLSPKRAQFQQCLPEGFKVSFEYIEKMGVPSLFKEALFLFFALEINTKIGVHTVMCTNLNIGSGLYRDVFAMLPPVMYSNLLSQNPFFRLMSEACTCTEPRCVTLRWSTIEPCLQTHVKMQCVQTRQSSNKPNNNITKGQIPALTTFSSPVLRYHQY